jgi:hypothetical protein
LSAIHAHRHQQLHQGLDHLQDQHVAQQHIYYYGVRGFVLKVTVRPFGSNGPG